MESFKGINCNLYSNIENIRSFQMQRTIQKLFKVNYIAFCYNLMLLDNYYKLFGVCKSLKIKKLLGF